MSKTLVLLIGLALTGVAQAQIKCWNDANGKRVCGDTPPPGAKTTTIKGTSPSELPAPAPSAKDGAKKDAKKGAPLTAAEKEKDYRKRREDVAKGAAKAEEEERNKAAKEQNCAQARDQLRTLESGERIARTDSKGERYILEDAQIAQEVARARQSMQQACN